MLGMALFSLVFADLRIQTNDPWFELSLMTKGFLSPKLDHWGLVLPALFKTLAFAVQGVVFSAILGFVFALYFKYTFIRVLAAFIRSIHELFWALLFIQMTGLSSLTGFLAILIPYTGVFAKVFSEILDECDKKAEESLSDKTSYLSLMLYTRVLLGWHQIKNYIAYRLECGIRSSAILGFVGLPTLGFELESFFKQGDYSEAAGLLYIFFILIFSLKYVFYVKLLPLYVLAAVIYLPPVATISWNTIKVFLFEDIFPNSLEQGDWTGFWEWSKMLWLNGGLEGVGNTFVLGQLALVLTGILALLLFPFRSSLFFLKPGRSLGHLFLVVLRSCPEYLLAFVGLLILGPSMLPAIIALGIHNSAIIGHLLALQTKHLKLREDVCRGVNLYFFEVIPRLYGNFLALLFYRWEIILRETAILGMLGIPTLGFFIDSAFEEVRFDRALFYILMSACLNIIVDYVSVTCRRKLHLHSQPELV